MIAPDFAQALLREYGSPLYAYDLDEVDQRARALRAVLPVDATLFYSLKANPLPALVETLERQGLRCGGLVARRARGRDGGRGARPDSVRGPRKDERRDGGCAGGGRPPLLL
jgi:hypothetical protein